MTFSTMVHDPIPAGLVALEHLYRGLARQTKNHPCECPCHECQACGLVADAQWHLRKAEKEDNLHG